MERVSGPARTGAHGLMRARVATLAPAHGTPELLRRLAPGALLIAVAAGCWLVTVQRMRGMDRAREPNSEDSAGSPESG